MTESENIKYGKINIINFSQFSNKMLIFRAGIHKMLVRIANRDCSVCLGYFRSQLVLEILEHIYLRVLGGGGGVNPNL